MKEEDLDKVAAIENAIAKKYGKEAIQNPKSNWNPEKEEKFLKDSKSFYRQLSLRLPGAFIKNLDHESDKQCSVCSKQWHFMKLEDELCFIKWTTCRDCYIAYIEAREEKWLSGWRPDKEGPFKN